MWGPDILQALFTALEPLVNSFSIHGLSFSFHHTAWGGQVKCKAHLGVVAAQALGRAVGSSVCKLALDGVQLAVNSLPALLAALPRLEQLSLGAVESEGCNLTARLMLLYHHLARPLTVMLSRPMNE
jgi:hypothetical protein